MRTLPFSVLVALAVIFAATSALAQGMGHCLNRPMVVVGSSVLSHELSREAKTPAKDLSWMSSRMERPLVAQRARTVPGQSRALVVCVDPNDPRCQVEMPDTPHRHGFGVLAWDAADAMKFFEGLPPPDGVDCAECPYTAGPREGVDSQAWRPPSA